MRTILKLVGIAGALGVAACSGSANVSDDLKSDLERASTATEITLPSAQAGTQVVSAIERATPPAPRKVAPSQRVARHTAAPRGIPAPVAVERAQVTPEVEAAPVEPVPAPAEAAPMPSPRPRPVATSGGVYGGGDVGRDNGGGIGNGAGSVIRVVLRGGVIDDDECDPRTDGRRRGGISINNRIPISGTFPGSGRINGPFNVGSTRGRF